MSTLSNMIIVEGLDGSGKTTLILSLAKTLGRRIVPRLNPKTDVEIKNKIKNDKLNVDQIHQLYMLATYMHLVDVIQPMIISREYCFIDKWIAGMLQAHTMRGGNLMEHTLKNFDWSSVRNVDCIFVRASNQARRARMEERGVMTDSDIASLSPEAETNYLHLCQKFYKRIILLESTHLDKQELLSEAQRILSV